MKKEHSVNYLLLRKAIIKSCKAKEGVHFSVNVSKLYTLVKDEFNLIPLNFGLQSKMVSVEDIPYISEYFKGKKLSWFDNEKGFTTIIFVQIESLDDRGLELVDILTKFSEYEDNVENYDSYFNSLTELLANYPCYTAMIVSYESTDLHRIGSQTYDIACRANAQVIEKEK